MSLKTKFFEQILQKKMLLILALGFASGLPLGLIGTTLQAWYTQANVDIVTIGFLALVGQPYVYKFFWSPLIDKWRLPFLGLRRGWMLATQAGCTVILCLMGTFNPIDAPYFLAFLALCLAILSATQDIAFDAYRTELLSQDERGLGAAMSTCGYRIAMLVSASLTLIIAHYVDFAFTYFLMAILMSLGMLATLCAKEPLRTVEKAETFLGAYIEPFKEFFARQHAVALLALVILYKLGDAFAGSLTTAFLLKGVGFSLLDIGLINKVVGVLSTLLGIFVGGSIIPKLGLYRSLWIFGVIQALTNLLFVLLSLVGPDYRLLVFTIGIENFGGGLGTAAFVVFVMALCHSRFTATQFALISALASIGRVFVGPVSGVMVNNVGWTEFYLWTVVFALPGLLVLRRLRGTIYTYEVIPKRDTTQDTIGDAKVNA